LPAPNEQKPISYFGGRLPLFREAAYTANSGNRKPDGFGRRLRWWNPAVEEVSRSQLGQGCGVALAVPLEFSSFDFYRRNQKLCHAAGAQKKWIAVLFFGHDHNC